MDNSGKNDTGSHLHHDLPNLTAPSSADMKALILKQASEHGRSVLKRRGQPRTKRPLPANTKAWDYSVPGNVTEVPIPLYKTPQQPSWNTSSTSEQVESQPDNQYFDPPYDLDPLAQDLDSQLLQAIEEDRLSNDVQASPEFPEPGLPHSVQESLLPPRRKVTQVQLINEVKGIYAGLVMVEKKCIEIDLQQSQQQKKLSPEQWEALIALHRTLLQEHHDFFLASQHPAASPALRQLASKYLMPQRMWKHGIDAFLEMLRHRSPEDTSRMRLFLRLAREMVEKLSETVPDLESHWQDCLDALDRYETFLQSPVLWNSSDLNLGNPDTESRLGAERDFRIAHHLAILRRPRQAQASSELFAPPDQDLWVLAGWYHLGRKFARSFRTYCAVFKILTLNVLL